MAASSLFFVEPLPSLNQFVDEHEKQDPCSKWQRKHVEDHLEPSQFVPLLPVHGINGEPMELPNVMHTPDEEDQNGNREEAQCDADSPESIENNKRREER